MRVSGPEPDVFRQLMEFAHTGRVDLMPRTIIGVICAADYYQFTGREHLSQKKLKKMFRFARWRHAVLPHVSQGIEK